MTPLFPVEIENKRCDELRNDDIYNVNEVRPIDV